MDTYHPRHMGSQSYKPARDARQSQFYICCLKLSSNPKSLTQREINAILISCCLSRWSPMSSNLSRMRQRTMQTSNTSTAMLIATNLQDNLTYRHLQRRPNNSIGCLEETKLRGKGEIKATDVLQVSISLSQNPSNFTNTDHCNDFQNREKTKRSYIEKGSISWLLKSKKNIAQCDCQFLFL